VRWQKICNGTSQSLFPAFATADGLENMVEVFGGGWLENCREEGGQVILSK
jgi:hypothetical protein